MGSDCPMCTHTDVKTCFKCWIGVGVKLVMLEFLGNCGNWLIPVSTGFIWLYPPFVWGNLCGMCGMGYITNCGIHWRCAMNHILMLWLLQFLHFYLWTSFLQQLWWRSVKGMVQSCVKVSFWFFLLFTNFFNTKFSDWEVIIPTWEWLNTTGPIKIRTK